MAIIMRFEGKCPACGQAKFADWKPGRPPGGGFFSRLSARRPPKVDRGQLPDLRQGQAQFTQSTLRVPESSSALVTAVSTG